MLIIFLFSVIEAEVFREFYVGIMMQPATKMQYPVDQYDYIAETYASFLKSEGLKIVAVPWRVGYEELDVIFENINGLVIPGGSTKIEGPSEYTKKVEYLVHKALIAKEQGDYFPIMGICLGHELLMYMFSGHDYVYKTNYLQIFFQHYKKFVQGTKKTQRSTFIVDDEAMPFKYFNHELYYSFTRYKVSYYNHVFAVTSSYFYSNKFLTKNFKVTALAYDDQGVEYIAATEGTYYPILTVQYHPEKPFSLAKEHQNYAQETHDIAQMHAYAFYKMVINNWHEFHLDVLLIDSFQTYENYQQGPIFLFHKFLWEDEEDKLLI